MSSNPTNQKKIRLDVLLVEKGLVSTRARAQAMILAGHVLVNDVPATKSGEAVLPTATLRLREPELKYVSRGALKLIKALDHFQVVAKDKIGIDVGSSTGGFTEVLLERGAKKVYAIDVGTNQLAWKLRSDPRVESRENTNARNLTPDQFSPKPELAVMDVSFISIRLILPVLKRILLPGSPILALFKPQFEVGREHVEVGGIVRDQSVALQTLESLSIQMKSEGLDFLGWVESPIQGTDGNHEYLTCWSTPGSTV